MAIGIHKAPLYLTYKWSWLFTFISALLQFRWGINLVITQKKSDTFTPSPLFYASNTQWHDPPSLMNYILKPLPPSLPNKTPSPSFLWMAVKIWRILYATYRLKCSEQLSSREGPTELSFLVILHFCAQAGYIGVNKKCSLVKMNHRYFRAGMSQVPLIWAC